MVQFTSPKPDIQLPEPGNQKVRTPGRTDDYSRTGITEKSGFAKALEKEKSVKASAEKKDVPSQQDHPDNEQPVIRSDHEKTGELKKAVLKDKSSVFLNKKSEKLTAHGILSDSEGSTGSIKLPVGSGKKSSLKKGTAQTPVSSLKPEVSPQNPGEKKISPDSAGSSVPEEVLNESEVTVEKAHVHAEASVTSVSHIMQTGQDQADVSSAGLQGNSLPADELKGRKGHRNPHSSTDQNRKESGIISVEDRRTVRTEDPKAVFNVSENNHDGKVQLEMQEPDELTGTLVANDLNDSGNSRFVLHSAEEQKGSLLLNKQLQEGGTRDLAKNIRFVLKDNNQGEIKLILKPEALGKVRIHLNLEENNIVGKIIVENNSVKQVFQNNLAELTRALEESGFDSASLDVSVGGGETGQHRGFSEDQPVFFQREAADLEDAIPVFYEEGTSLSQIDLVI